MTSFRRYFFALAGATIAALILPGSASAAPTVTQVASGLDSPRGIAFFDGNLVVAEAGHGGSDCFNAPGVPFPICIGATSQITKIDIHNGNKTPLVTGLFSVSLGPEGNIGVSGLSVSGERLLAQIGATPREAPPTITIAQQEAGQLIAVRENGSWNKVAPVGASDFDYTTQFTEPNPAVCGQCPGTQEHDANPYGVLATDDGALVADAGANTLDRIGEDGRIKILLHDGWRDPNPNFPSDAVPTCIVRTGDGLLVGELSGRVLRVHGSTFTVIHNPLLTHITACTSDRHGNVYFVNMFGSGAPFTPPPASNFFTGSIVKYDAETGHASTVYSAPFLLPNMDTIGPDGNLYVTVGSICPSPQCGGATGGVIKVSLPHEESDD